MRCFDGSEQQRRDPHTSRAQRARGRCAIVHLKPRVVSPWRFSKKITGFVTSRSESSLNLPHFRYHSIVAPWVAMWGGMERGAVRRGCGHSLGWVDREDIGPLQWHFLQCELAPEKTIRWRAAVRTALTAATTGLVVVEAIVAC